MLYTLREQPFKRRHESGRNINYMLWNWCSVGKQKCLSELWTALLWKLWNSKQLCQQMVLLWDNRDTDTIWNVNLPLKTSRESKGRITFVAERFRFEMCTRCHGRALPVEQRAKRGNSRCVKKVLGVRNKSTFFSVQLRNTAFPFVIIPQSAILQVHSHFQSHFSAACDLVLPLSIQYPLLSLTSLRLLPRLPRTSVFLKILCFRSLSLSNIWPVQNNVAEVLNNPISNPNIKLQNGTEKKWRYKKIQTYKKKEIIQNRERNRRHRIPEYGRDNGRSTSSNSHVSRRLHWRGF